MKWQDMYSENGRFELLFVDLIIFASRPFQKAIDQAPKDHLFFSSQTLYTGLHTTDDLAEEAKAGEDFWNDEGQYSKYVDSVKKQLDENDHVFRSHVKKLREEKNLPLEELKTSYHDLSKATLESCGIYVMTQPQRQTELEKKLQKEISTYVSAEEVPSAFVKLTQYPELSSLQKERIAFLDLCQKNEQDFQPHLDMYAHIGVSPWAKSVWRTVDVCAAELARFQKDAQSFLQEIENLSTYGASVKREKAELLNKIRLTEEAQRMSEKLAELGYLRQELHFSFDQLLYLISLCAEKIAVLIGKETDDLLYHRHEDIVALLDQDLRLSDEEVARRKQAFLFLILRDEERFFSGDEAVKRYREQVPEENYEHIQEFKGSTACAGTARGIARIFAYTADSPELQKQLSDFAAGDILIATQTTPLLMPAITKAGGIVTNEGGITCHAAIVSRELGIPCVIGTKVATKAVSDGDEIEIDATKGLVKILKRTTTIS